MLTAEPSALDSARFGVAVMRSSDVSAGSATDVVEHARRAGASLLMVRCPVGQISAAQEVERLGGRLMDTLLWFGRSTEPVPDPAAAARQRVVVRAATAADTEACADLARASFRGYAGHYHADPRLDPTAATEVYASWAAHSCSGGGAADAALVAVADGRLVGLSTVRTAGAGRAEGPLDAVHPAARGSGVYACLNAARIAWCRSQGLGSIEVSTHVANRAAQRGLQRLGFVFDRADYTFHLWLDGGE